MQIVNSVGQENFDWIVNNVAELAVRKAMEHTGKVSEYRWSAFLGGGVPKSQSPAIPKTAAAPKAETASEPAPGAPKPGTMLEAASKQLRKRATKG